MEQRLPSTQSRRSSASERPSSGAGSEAPAPSSLLVEPAAPPRGRRAALAGLQLCAGALVSLTYAVAEYLGSGRLASANRDALDGPAATVLAVYFVFASNFRPCVVVAFVQPPAVSGLLRSGRQLAIGAAVCGLAMVPLGGGDIGLRLYLFGAFLPTPVLISRHLSRALSARALSARRSPLARSPLARSPFARSPLARPPLARSPLARSPLARSRALALSAPSRSLALNSHVLLPLVG